MNNSLSRKGLKGDIPAGPGIARYLCRAGLLRGESIGRIRGAAVAVGFDALQAS